MDPSGPHVVSVPVPDPDPAPGSILTSESGQVSASVEALATIRSHWAIENRLHWVLDVAFREDDCRVRSGNAAENFAVLRHFTMNLLKNAPSKRGIKTRRLQAGWDHGFLFRTLCG